MRNRLRSRAIAYAAALAAAIVSNGCALITMVQVTPPVGSIGEPLTFQIKVTNPAACTLTAPELIFVPLVERGAEVDEFCSFAQNPALALCNNVDDPGDLPQEVLAACCTDPTFEMDHPMLCGPSGAMSDAPQTLAQQVQEALSSHPVTTTAIVAASATTQAAVTCSFNGSFFDCLLDDIAAGQSETVTLTVTPTMNGSFANFLVVEGTLPCVDSQFPGGSACLDTTVGLAPAPTLSHEGLAAGVLLLAAVAAWRLRARYRPRA
jgi:hypothetical protein